MTTIVQAELMLHPYPADVGITVHLECEAIMVLRVDLTIIDGRVAYERGT